MLEVVRDVVVHRAEQLEADRGRPHHVEVDPVSEPGAVLVDELLHRHPVVLLGGREILLERVTRPGFVGLEQLVHPLAVRGDVDAVAVLPEDPVVGVEAFELVEVARFVAEVAEEPLEHVGHQIPGGPHIEAEALGLEDGGATAQPIVFLQERDIEAGVGEITRRGKPAETGADDHDGTCRRHTTPYGREPH